LKLKKVGKTLVSAVPEFECAKCWSIELRY